MYKRIRDFFLSGQRSNTILQKVKILQYHTDLVKEQQNLIIHQLNHINQQLNKANIDYRLSDPKPTFPEVKSQLCTYEQMITPEYLAWCKASNNAILPVCHRKEWEFCYILQALKESGKIKSGSKGLGFAVGLEPLPALLVNAGCQIVATDLDLNTAIEKGWASGQVQHASRLQDLNKDNICNPEIFSRNASFRFVNMKDIPEDLREFDFLWSSCSLEHLGSIDAGVQYVLNAMKCLKSGGVAVHTTEFNLSSDFSTVDNQDTVIFRKRDILRLKQLVEEAGYQMAPLTFNAGNQPEDQYIDIPPYKQFDCHLKLLLELYVTTSIGFIIYKS